MNTTVPRVVNACLIDWSRMKWSVDRSVSVVHNAERIECRPHRACDQVWPTLNSHDTPFGHNQDRRNLKGYDRANPVHWRSAQSRWSASCHGAQPGHVRAK